MARCEETYERWLERLDDYLSDNLGHGIDETPNPDYRTYYDQGLSLEEILELEDDR